MNPPARILVVDDEAPSLELVSGFLSEEGYDVRTSASGQEGLKLARAERPDVAILGMALADLDGLEICRQIKADPALADTFVVLVSSQEMDASHRIEGLAAGADDCLAKPVCREEFVSRVGALARIQRAASALRKSEARWHSLVRNSSDYILTLNGDGRILFINRPFSGMRIEQVNGALVYEFVQPEFHYDLREILRRIIETGRPGQIEAAISVSEGPPLRLLIKATACRQEGKPEIIVNATDITRKKWVEEALTSFTQSLEQRIADRTVELAAANQKLQAEIAERKEAKEALMTSERRLREINELQGLLLPPNSIGQKLKLVTEAVVRIANADFARIWMIEPGDRCETGCIHAQASEGPHTCRFREKCLHLMASSGRYTHIDGRDHRRVPFGCYKIGRIAAAEESRFLTNDAANDPRVHNHAWAKELGLVSFAGYRLADADGKPLGVLALFSKQAISAEEDSLLEGIAHATSQVLRSERAEAALRESAIRYQTLVDRAPMAVFINRADKVVLVNEACLRLFGATAPEQLLGKSPFELFHPDFHSTIRERIRQMRDEGKAVPLIEEKIVRLDGASVDVEVTAAPFKDQGVDAIHVVLLDITWRKRAEEALARSEQRFRMLIEKSMEGLTLLGADGAVRYQSSSLLRLQGYTPEERDGRDGFELVHPGDLAATKESFARLQGAAGGSAVITVRMRHKDGSWRWFEAVVTNQLAEPAIGAFIINFRDITERKREEEALRQSEEKYRALIETTNTGFLILDAQGKVIDANRDYVKLTGHDAIEDILGRSVVEWTAPHDLERNASEVKKCAARGFVRNLEIDYVNRGGQITPVEINATVVGSGGSARILSLCRDITGRKRAEEELRCIQKAVEGTSDAIGMATSAGAHFYQNEAFTRMFGYTVEELNQPLGPVVAYADPAVGRTVFETIMRGESWRGEVDMAARDGRRVPVDLRADAIKDNQGRVMGLIGIHTDITGRKRAEEELRKHREHLEELVEERTAELKESEERYRALFEHSPDAILIANPQTARFLGVNPAACRLLGYEAAELTRLRVADIHPAESLPHIMAVFTAMTQGRFVTIPDAPCLRKDGAIVHVDLSAASITLAGKPCLMGMFHDTTERQRTERALRESEEQYRQLFEGNPNPMWVFEEGTLAFLAVNEASVRHYGYSRPEFLAMTIKDIRPAEEVPVLLEAIESLRGQTAARGGVWLHRKKDGTLMNMEIIASSVTFQNRAARLVMAIDVSERERTNAMQKVAREAAEQAFRAKGEFLASMSHELRTPLNSVLGMAEALTEQTLGALNEKQLKLARTIYGSGQCLLELINDLLDLSRIEAGKFEVELGPVSARPVCVASLQLIRETARQKRLQVEVDLGEEVITVQADERRLKQILVNLLRNAVKFTPEGGTIGLALAGDAGRRQVRFIVWDSGAGITPEDQARLFEPFVQLDGRLSRQHSGAGLGLALAQRLAALQGGRMSLESEPGKGSRFIVTLPWQPEAQAGLAATNAEPARKRPAEAVCPGRTEQPLILVAEDNEDNFILLSMCLVPHHYRIARVVNGNEAIERARVLRPAILLMDAQMPGMDGLEATRRIRAEPELAGIPIIMLTAFAMPGDRERCLAAGASDYLSKPLDMKQLVALIEKHLQQSA